MQGIIVKRADNRLENENVFLLSVFASSKNLSLIVTTD